MKDFLVLAGGKRYTPKDSDEVRCDVHGTVTTYGDLDPIQRLALSEGLDTISGLKCLLATGSEDRS